MSEKDDDYLFNETRWAGTVLNQVLDETSDEALAELRKEKVDVREEVQSRRIIDSDTGRTLSRLLFVTDDKDALAENSEIEKRYLEIAPEFDEVHVLVFTTDRLKNAEPRRRAKNVWFYPVCIGALWHMRFVAKREAWSRLTFNGSIRPDILIGVDPFDAGRAASIIAKSFNRPWQLHIYSDVFSKPIGDKKPQFDSRHKRLAKSMVKKAKWICVKTDTIKDSLAKYIRKGSQINVLPKFYNFTGSKNTEPTFNLHKKYPAFTFVMVVFGDLTADSKLHDIFTAIHEVLRNPHIGLVVVGDGHAKGLFVEKSKILGIEKNVVFEPSTTDMYSILKTSDVLIEDNTSQDSEIRVMRAASVGLPLIIAETDLRKDLFTDGDSAFLFESGDIVGIKQKLNRFINTGVLRLKFSREGKAIADSRLEEDPSKYFASYRNIVESVLLDKSDKK